MSKDPKVRQTFPRRMLLSGKHLMFQREKEHFPIALLALELVLDL
jgi:hypothetical protein